VFEYFKRQLSYQMIAALLYGQRFRISLLASTTQVLQSEVETSPLQRSSPYVWSGVWPLEPIPKPVGGAL